MPIGSRRLTLAPSAIRRARVVSFPSYTRHSRMTDPILGEQQPAPVEPVDNSVVDIPPDDIDALLNEFDAKTARLPDSATSTPDEVIGSSGPNVQNDPLEQILAELGPTTPDPRIGELQGQ